MESDLSRIKTLQKVFSKFWGCHGRVFKGDGEGSKNDANSYITDVTENYYWCINELGLHGKVSTPLHRKNGKDRASGLQRQACLFVDVP